MSDPRTHQPNGRPRGRGLGLPFLGETGPYNAITDVGDVQVGYTTLIEGEGALKVGTGPVRTGVTAILPRGLNGPATPVWAACFSLNGNGEMTGTHWIEEAGFFDGPVSITNTHSCGLVHHAVVGWMTRGEGSAPSKYDWALPVIAETCDSHLNDMNGQHVTEAHALDAIKSAMGGPIAEGSVGGGTGMICYEFKGGTGTASRIVEIGGERYTIGALVQANHGVRPWFTVLGVPVGKHLTNDTLWSREQGSIITVIATDLPLLPNQLKRVAKRISIGIGRAGTPSGDNSGDIFLAFSTANAGSFPAPRATFFEEPDASLCQLSFVPGEVLDPVFLATIEAVDEAVINAILGSETMVGRDDNQVAGLDHEALRDVMGQYNRLQD